MDYKRFTDQKTGQLRKFRNPSTGKEDWLFIPDVMPPNWEFTERLWPLLVEAKEALGTLNGIGRTLPNPDLLLRPLQNREAITSSSIEGTYVTPQQLLIYDLDSDDAEKADAEGSSRADWREVFDYRAALMRGCRLVVDGPITNSVIRNMHETLMLRARGRDTSPGEFRKIQVQIGSTGKYVPPHSSEVPTLMGNLERYINEGDERYDPLILGYIVHYQIEAIHPFSDGNGRIGRVLLALMIYKLLGHSMPWLYLSAFFEKYRDEYTDKLFRISTHGDWEQWIEYCLLGTIRQAADSILRCDRIGRLKDTYYKLGDASGTPRSRQIIDRLFYSPVITVPAIRDLCKTHYQTAKSDILSLIEVGVLSELSNGRPKSYYAHELFHIAYGNDEGAE